jgi:hypothetical protein
LEAIPANEHNVQPDCRKCSCENANRHAQLEAEVALSQCWKEAVGEDEVHVPSALATPSECGRPRGHTPAREVQNKSMTRVGVAGLVGHRRTSF